MVITSRLLLLKKQAAYLDYLITFQRAQPPFSGQFWTRANIQVNVAYLTRLLNGELRKLVIGFLRVQPFQLTGTIPMPLSPLVLHRKIR